jgi:hypothetical protein
MKILLICITLLLVGCIPEQISTTSEEEMFITIKEEKIEIVLDEYDNPYLKQYTYMGKVLYIPFPFKMSEEEIPRVYEAKLNKK